MGFWISYVGLVIICLIVGVSLLRPFYDVFRFSPFLGFLKLAALLCACMVFFAILKSCFPEVFL